MKRREDILNRMPKAHPGIEEWIYTYCAAGPYIIYDRHWHTAICTGCGKKIPDESWMRHNEYGECPKCGHSVQYKAAGRGRGNMWDSFRILECSHSGKTVWMCCWKISLNYEPFGRPRIGRSLTDIFVINEKEQHHYKETYNWATNQWEIEEVKSMHLAHASGGAMYGYNTPPLETVYVYRKNLESVFKKSCLKYLWDAQFIEGLSAYQLVNYISMGMRWNSVELLKKAGFQHITMERINELPGSGACNWRGSSLQKILRLPMGDIRYIRQHNPSFNELKTYRQFPEDIRQKVPWELFAEVSTYRYPGDWGNKGYNQWIRRLNEYTDLKQWVSYITKHQGEKPFTLDDWIDYIEVAKKLGIDLRRKSKMYPEDFWKTHDEAVNALECQRIDIQTKLLKQLKKELTYEDEKLVVKVATTQGQLNRESGSLHHCVKTYGEKLRDGKCLIFFIREKEAPGRSYFTLETDVKGGFRQCRGYCNCGMPTEVKNFVDEFVKHLKKTIKERKAA